MFTFPNLLTVLRLPLVALIVYFLIEENYKSAFGCFLVAGITDLIDGILARALDQRSKFGAWLDPAADKALIVILFGLLGYMGHVPVWLAGLVIFRDIMIVAAVADLHFTRKPLVFAPLMVSKINTAAQILYLALVLAHLSSAFALPVMVDMAGYIVGVLTALSFLAYFRLWLRYRAMAAPSSKSW